MATSTKSKNKYNRKAYKQWSVRLKPEIYNVISAYCEEHNLSRSEFLNIAINALTTEKQPNS